VEIDAVENNLRRMQTAEAFLDRFVDLAVIRNGRLPTHATNEANRFHSAPQRRVMASGGLLDVKFCPITAPRPVAGQVRSYDRAIMPLSEAENASEQFALDELEFDSTEFIGISGRLLLSIKGVFTIQRCSIPDRSAAALAATL
jgi:hypothetical protein